MNLFANIPIQRSLFYPTVNSILQAVFFSPSELLLEAGARWLTPRVRWGDDHTLKSLGSNNETIHRERSDIFHCARWFKSMPTHQEILQFWRVKQLSPLVSWRRVLLTSWWNVAEISLSATPTGNIRNQTVKKNCCNEGCYKQLRKLEVCW